MPRYEYKAIKCTQTEGAPDLVLFSAPALEIEFWSGVPQKTQLGDVESTGFQRELQQTRLQQLAEFYDHPKNIIPNPLICATRSHSLGTIKFVPATDKAELVGSVQIEMVDLGTISLLELLENVSSDLERRLPELSKREVDPTRLQQLREQASIEGHNIEESEGNFLDEDEAEIDAEAPLATVVEGESQIIEFWEEIVARIALLKELGNTFEGDSFLGYSSAAMVSFLKPVIVVDGQHRLQGAITAINHKLEEDKSTQKKLADLIDSGVDSDSAKDTVSRNICRTLPISMLLTDEPQEHVFQFVIVNQKATPISRPLLGTIISTTLTNPELRKVSKRLESAGIPLDDSRAIIALSRDHNSPFYNLVDRGLASRQPDALAWSVFGGLVKIFRDLRGGKIFAKPNDYADKWKRVYLEKSKIVSDYSSLGYDDPFDYWRHLEGPWKDVFICFWAGIRTRFGSEDLNKPNYWGNPRKSNLFNKISLTILASDFFQFLCERARRIDSTESMDELLSEWLEGVDERYFDRNWRLREAGVKKDSRAIQKLWAENWVEYRKDPRRLPRCEKYAPR